jgi:hypothetical protein
LLLLVGRWVQIYWSSLLLTIVKNQMIR